MKILHKGSNKWKYVAGLLIGLMYSLLAIIGLAAGILLGYFLAYALLGAWLLLVFIGMMIYYAGGYVLTAGAQTLPFVLRHWPTFTILALVIAILFLLFWLSPDEDEYNDFYSKSIF